VTAEDEDQRERPNQFPVRLLADVPYPPLCLPLPGTNVCWAEGRIWLQVARLHSQGGSFPFLSWDVNFTREKSLQNCDLIFGIPAYDKASAVRKERHEKGIGKKSF
jgi:hypothetical protein